MIFLAILTLPGTVGRGFYGTGVFTVYVKALKQNNEFYRWLNSKTKNHKVVF